MTKTSKMISKVSTIDIPFDGFNVLFKNMIKTLKIYSHFNKVLFQPFLLSIFNIV